VFGDLGLLADGCLKPTATGGDLTWWCIAKEEIGKVSLAASTLCANNSIGLILPLLHFGSEAQQQRYCPKRRRPHISACDHRARSGFRCLGYP